MRTYVRWTEQKRMTLDDVADLRRVSSVKMTHRTHLETACPVHLGLFLSVDTSDAHAALDPDGT